MISDEKLQAIETYARTLPNPIFALDFEQLVAEVRRLSADLAAHEEHLRFAIERAHSYRRELTDREEAR
jgi:hypothetical protein